jgi:hypothetical protein
LREEPTLSEVRIRQLLEPLGCSAGKTVVDGCLREVRPLFAPAPRTCARAVRRPGEVCQLDVWQPREEITDSAETRPNANDRAWRSGAREPFSTLPELDRSFGSMAEQRTTNASGLPVASDEHSLTVGPNAPTVLQDDYVVQKMQHFNARAAARARRARQGQRRAQLFEVTADVTQWTDSQDVSDDVQGRMIGYWTRVDANLGARVAAGLGCGAGSARREARTRHGTSATRSPRRRAGHEAPRPRLSPGSLLALTASYFYGGLAERLAGEDDR